MEQVAHVMLADLASMGQQLVDQGEHALDQVGHTCQLSSKFHAPTVGVENNFQVKIILNYTEPILSGHPTQLAT